MAIFPLYNKHATNYPATVNENFTSGMALVIDSSGNAIKADRTNVSYNSIFEGYGKFLGFASGDHTNISSVLMSDPVGSNYISSDNKFVDNVNSHYSASKRSISEFRDESVSGVLFSEYSKRGIGVFNLQGEIYITDQFARVESLFIDSDGTAQLNFNVGDLLTYGAGVNAGKLVKVDTSAISPSVLIIGVVEKFDEASNLLYFRHVLESYNNTVSLFTTGIAVHLDASNPTSYSGSGLTWYDLSGNGLNAELQNGVLWSSENGGVMTFDGTNDQALVADNSLLDFPGDFTIEGALIKQVGGGGWLHRRSSDAEANWVLSATGGNSMWFLIRYSGSWYPPALDQWGGENSFTKYNHVIVTRNSGVINCYYNGTLRFSFNNSLSLNTSTGFVIGSWDSYGLWSKLKTPFVRLYSQGMTAEQVRQNYNASMGKLI